MRYKVIFLDWDGTLSNSRFWSHFSDAECSALTEAIFQDRRLLHSWMKGGYSSEQICKIAADRCWFQKDYLFLGLVESCQNMEFIEPNVLKTIQKHRKAGTKVVIATDNMDTFTRFTVPGLGLDRWFDDILDSYSLQMLKTEQGKQGFFSDYLIRNSFGPEDSVLIDDRLDNRVVEDTGMAFEHVTLGRLAHQILQDLL